MKTKVWFLAIALFIANVSLCARAEEITPAGKHLAAVLDGMHVDTLWLSGRRVEWRSGKSLTPFDPKAEGHTHCSAFAAAASEKLGIYLLRPPEHSSTLLANAQQEWLCGTGTNQGWHSVESANTAQHLANQGQLVVVTCKNPDPKLPGHIAIVRPSTKSEAEILKDGPQVIQAGRHNYLSTTTREGFKNHVGAFENKQLLYFVHSLPATLSAN